MAIYWLGTATAVAQVDTVQVTAYDAATTYRLTVGGTIVSTIAQGSVNATATGLAAAWNASTHPYFTAVTAVANTDTVTLTGDTAGVPFTATSSVSGGTGTIGAVTSSTACSGPNHWDTAANWSGGAVPIAADEVYIANSDVNICWGLGQSAVDLDELHILQTYTGKIGLRYDAFATSSDGETVTETKPEYRLHYLDIESDKVEIGQHIGPGTPNGSPRIKLDIGVHVNTVTVHNTARVSSESGLPCVRILADQASTVLHVRRAPGGVGVACEESDETSTLAKISISDTTTTSVVTTGRGTTVTTWEQTGGSNVLQMAAAVTTCTCSGGTLGIEGYYIVTTLNVEGGTVNSNNVPSAGAAHTTINLKGGTLSSKQSTQARTWTTVNVYEGATLEIDKDVVTLTNGLALAEGPLTIKS